MVPAPIGRGSVQICTLIEGFGEFPFVALARIRCHALPLFGHHPASGKRLGESEEPTPYETISISYGQGSLQLGFLSRGIVQGVRFASVTRCSESRELRIPDALFRPLVCVVELISDKQCTCLFSFGA